jgi:hypothetical protein
MTVKEAGMGLPAKAGHRGICRLAGHRASAQFQTSVSGFLVAADVVRTVPVPAQIKDFNLFLMKYLL